MKYKFFRKHINFFVLLSVSFIIIFALAFTANMISGSEKTKYIKNTVTPPLEYNDLSAVQASSDTYMVKEYNGIIGFFKTDSEEPFLTITTPLCTLPEKDALLLKEGIIIYGDDALRSILEDFSG